MSGHCQDLERLAGIRVVDVIHRAALLLGVLVVAFVIGPTRIAAGADRLRASIGGADVPRDAVASVLVDQDLDQPDMAVVVVDGRKGLRLAGRFAPADDVAVVVQPGSTAVFKGEIVGIEPVFEAGGTARVIVRAFNRLHRLTRGQKTRTFDDTTDAEVVTTIAHEHGLVPAPSSEPPVRYDHVFQHNQTDLEFLRVRAARLGYDVWVEDTTLYFGRRDPAPAVPADRVKTFHPRLSSTATVQTVIVRGWDPDRRREIVGTAIAPTISLDPHDPRPGLVFGQTLEMTVDEPIASQDQANAIAKSKLEELALAHITGEASAGGEPGLKPGVVVTIDATNDRFDGRYLVAATRHRFSHGEGCGGGYTTALRLRREDLGLFRIPHIDDEVLIAFEHGDIRHPVVVGSLWETDDRCASDDRGD